MFVAKIHNNSLGKCFNISSIDEGIKFIIGMAEEELGRNLTKEELQELNTSYELYNDEDCDNQYTWSIGKLENE